MREELNSILENEIEAIRELLETLDKQHKVMIENDVFGMDSCVTELEACNRKIAGCEVKRRAITKGESMNKLVQELGDQKLEYNYREIKKLLQETVLQKDTNELLIKQGLGYTSRLLNILNPNRGSKTYNSYGKVGR